MRVNLDFEFRNQAGEPFEALNVSADYVAMQIRIRCSMPRSSCSCNSQTTWTADADY